MPDFEDEGFYLNYRRNFIYKIIIEEISSMLWDILILLLDLEMMIADLKR